MTRNRTYRDTQKQQIIRLKILKKRGPRCEHCGREGMVELHHIKEIRDGGDFDEANLILLCPVCHLKAHGKTPNRIYEYMKVSS